MISHSRAQLESWIDAFRDSDAGVEAEIRVLEQDTTEGGDAGLIEIKLVNATTTTVIEPKRQGSRQWVAVFEARETELRLECSDIAALARELLLVSELCKYLESRDWG